MQKRAFALFALVCACFLSLMVKIVASTEKEYSAAAKNNSVKTIEIASSRGKIYDRNLNLLVDRENRLFAAIVPSLKSADTLKEILGEERSKKVLESGKPFVGVVTKETQNEDVKTFKVPVRYDKDSLARHLVGYLDKQTGNGLSGIEKGYNSFLKENSGRLSVSFQVDALGNVIYGMKKAINDENFNSNAGVVLTLSSKAQKVAEDALKNSNIKSGCAVVMHVNSGEIYALACVPNFEQDKVSKSLKNENSPLLNKALLSYSAGSVFKPLVAAYALESGISEKFEYTCNGKCRVGDKEFRCYNSKSHGKENMAKALQNSCNTYFVNLIQHLDYSGLLSLCRMAGLASETKLAEGIVGGKGILPDDSTLIMSGEKANFSFGQGRFLLSPVQMAGIYHVLATGNYVEPTVFYGYCNNDKLVKKERAKKQTPVLSHGTVKKIRKMLSLVVEKGNAKKASSTVLSLAGKTGTAQSGIYNENAELCRTWFAGFFPSQNPHYIVVVLNENGVSGSSDCAPVFKKICEGLINVY